MKNIVLILFLSLLSILKTHGQKQPDLSWKVGFHENGNDLPRKWIDAVVPGAVQLDYARSEKYGPYFYADNWKDYLWMEDKFWSYQAEFSKPFLSEGQRLFFISKGIDYKFDIILNGKNIKSQEGMFTRVEIDITGELREKNKIMVRIYPIPKIKSSREDRSQAAQSVKPAVSYGWDWHPRLVPSGIWDETWLEIKDKVRIENYSIDYDLNPKLDTAVVFVNAQLSESGHKYSFELFDRSGRRVLMQDGIVDNNKLSISMKLPRPALWWSWDQGEPYLYEMHIKLLNDNQVLDEVSRKVGFRKARLVMNAGAWNVEGFPKSRSNSPITLELNGRRIFCKGSNWVNPEIFPGIITRERYKELLDLAQKANFNLLRVWGGGIVNKDSFFELCDEIGIMVWQEFPLACNNYEGTPEYLTILKQEATSIVTRLKSYPALVLWCGGNELFNSWSGMTDQSLALRLLNSLTFELDPKRPFIMTSPEMGMGHGHYVFRDPDSKEEVFQWMPRSKNTAYTEFGVPSPSGVEVLKSFLPPDQLWPPKPGTVWETHHAYHAWVGNTWLMQDMIESYFGPSNSLDELVNRGQLIQSQGYKCIYEEARRQKPFCSMALNWCYNEPWPTAANNSLLNYPAIPKPAFDAVSASCRPVLASARIRKFSWKTDEGFTIDLYMLNDSPNPVPPGKMTVKIAGDEDVKILEWDFPEIPANENLAGPTARISIPEWECEMFDLILSVENKPEYNSDYTLLLKKSFRPGMRNTLNQ